MASGSDNLGQPARQQGKWEMIGPPGCPLMFRRTLLAGRLGKLLVHRFVPGATDKDPHDHPRPFLTIVLRGGYGDFALCATCRSSAVRGWLLGDPSDDWRRAQPMRLCPDCGGSEQRVDRLRAPALRFRCAEHAHVTEVHPDGALTLVIMGPLRRDWGFWREGRWWPWRSYERRFGLGFRCEDDVVA